jgi:hypothetical protein
LPPSHRQGRPAKVSKPLLRNTSPAHSDPHHGATDQSRRRTTVRTPIRREARAIDSASAYISGMTDYRLDPKNPRRLTPEEKRRLDETPIDYSDIPPLFDVIDWSRCPDVESVPDRCSGAWVVKGTRIPVQAILDNAEAGCSAEEIAGPNTTPAFRLTWCGGFWPMLWADSLADVARRVRAGATFGMTLANFLDNFYCNPEQRAAMIADEPAKLDNARDHATLGAVAEHLARRWNLAAVPAWTNDPSRFLREPYFTTPIEALWPVLMQESPPAFRRRMIYTEAEPLRRARTPRKPCPPRERARRF